MKCLHVKLVFSSKKGSTICSARFKPRKFMWTLNLLFSVVALCLKNWELSSPLGIQPFSSVYQFSNKINLHSTLHVQTLSNKLSVSFSRCITKVCFLVPHESLLNAYFFSFSFRGQALYPGWHVFIKNGTYYRSNIYITLGVIFIFLFPVCW